MLQPFEESFKIVSLAPGSVNIRPVKLFRSVDVSPDEARRMAAHLVKVADYLDGMDAALNPPGNGGRN